MSGIFLVAILSIFSVSYLQLYHNTVDAKSNQKGANALHVEYTIPYMSDEDLAASSPIIIQGIVKSVSSVKWNNPKGLEPSQYTENDMLYRDNIISVSDVLKGDVKGNEITVRTYRGDYPQGENIVKIDTGDAYGSFSQGESVILFLANDDSNYNKDKSNNYYILKGMNQGKFLITGKTIASVHGSKELNTFKNNIKNHKKDIVKPNVKGDF
ncbi:hypothetical protein Dtox_1768 [Desulfofarcimen acetoxidans DSM 771]|uniref:Uncharacterized protein n=1 Tax=Desulfofarcimen acetoxidans (strain ATCC 49208 / DSM 771 / KCTC 5769 / VKM B-1644 / 5575) TaxID=485916 RepID=C8VX46_DESAS|nr:hypothetical protein [Desulfofarcimen acetoxidans]ACV62622.1 hypothetical protein Dtox_1768 [Desulfofarcimen acetoxidans DSM 771]